eukprot:CAMPEP_0181073842 /NCGR_PEP_ID=MMETSP1070-20121207/29294_1 /TAXON_ID=265543 /ORGANISM="Minutocellus polymorphus, Strain NH13" /LENGTH=602 /DNA_ID=CAMNT_0023154939 /DNA_START=312 /DNA_END=2120 /DNA_ORIENTATION=+
MTRDRSAEASTQIRERQEELAHTSQENWQHVVAIDTTNYRRGLTDFNNHLTTLSKRCLDDSGDQEDVIGCAALAEGLLYGLQRLVDDADANGKDIEFRPDVISYNNVLNAWAKAAQALAEDRGRGTPDSTLDADISELNVYTPSDAAARAEMILQDMETSYLRGTKPIAPDVTSYNTVLDAISKSRGKDCMEKADALVKRMVRLSNGGEEGKEGVVNGSADDWSGATADIITYNTLIESLAHTQEGLDRSLQILEMLEKKYSENGDERLKPNTRTANQVINAYSKHSMEKSKKGYFENKEDREEAFNNAEKARALLEKMKKRYNETADKDVRPDAATVTTVIDAYARVGLSKSAAKADELLMEMKKMNYAPPNFRTYTAVATAWAKTPGDNRSLGRVQELVKEMEDVNEQMEADAKGKSIPRAKSVKPNARTYTTLISAWAKSKDPTKAMQALKVLKKMRSLADGGDEDAKPTIYTYNAVIDACARCQGLGEQQVEALKIAFAVNKAIKADSDVKANPTTFGNLIKCTKYLIPQGDERNTIATAVFESAIKAGLANSAVVREMLSAADRDAFDKVAGDLLDTFGHVSYADIPSAWKRNASGS